ncbi:hypothetical protein CIPAW_12G046700 [Carya illinoinensis]|uniref:Uncharacterized protein n=1 Tax=Carya illinoinensis TaxID=32201 RepID=A0A8T1NN03_CARIL|nr:hypothetical protein CIPAW_12G046700 [Carya illinoinensis]
MVVEGNGRIGSRLASTESETAVKQRLHGSRVSRWVVVRSQVM